MKIVKFTFIFLFVALFFYIHAPRAYASNRIILKTDFKIWTVYLNHADFFSNYKKTSFYDLEIEVDEDQSALVNKFLHNKDVEGMDTMKIRQYLENKIAPDIYREREDVVIDMDENNNITFEGRGLYGRKLDLEKAALMVKYAIENDISFVYLPLIREYPNVTVLSEELKEMGIKELFSAGETDFSRSPRNRINNIKVGLNRFNGHIIKSGEEFVLGRVLGPVNHRTGFLPELVIKGDRTVPEYGGGLCQVSTTAYRAILAGGFPVTQRKNHSYAVRYYEPHGLDATIYPPSVDLRFINNSPAHILIQTLTIGNKAYYNFYGTKDSRKVYMIGPYYYGHRSPPKKRVEYTDKLAPGVINILGHSISGFNSSWYRQVIYSDPEKEGFLEHIFSRYSARPHFTAIGTSKKVKPSDSDLENGY